MPQNSSQSFPVFLKGEGYDDTKPAALFRKESDRDLFIAAVALRLAMDTKNIEETKRLMNLILNAFGDDIKVVVEE